MVYNYYRKGEKIGMYNGIPETTAFERYAVKTSEKANVHNPAVLHQPDPLALCTLEAQEKRTPCVDSRMLSTSVASPCQTLRGLLARDHE